MAIDILALPELAAIVAQYLSPRDIAACKLTSRAFNNTFNPYLWKHLSVKNDKSKQLAIFERARTSVFLCKNRQYIKTLSLEIFAAEYLQTLLLISVADKITKLSTQAQGLAGTPPHPLFPSLKSLGIAVGAIDVHSHLSEKDAVLPDGSLKILLDRAPNITSLTLYPEVLESANFMARLKSGLPHLKTLILKPAPKLSNKSFPFSPMLSALPLLFAKPKLTTLELDFSLSYNREVSPVLIAKTMKELAENSSAISAITSMVFPRTLYASHMAFVKPIFEFCLPQLQVLTVPSVGAQDLARLVDVVPDHCPHVCELNLARLGSGSASRAMVEQVVRLIKAYKGLRAYRGPAFGAGEDRRAITHALLQHASTLESLVLMKEMKSCAFSSLFSSMSALRTLVIGDTLRVGVESAISVCWVPRRLQTLEMTIEVNDSTVEYVKSQYFDRNPELNPDVLTLTGVLDEKEFRYVAMRKLFKNIGELTELEDLYIKHSPYGKWKFDKDWSLKVGLGFLDGLVKLRKLRLDYGVHHVGQAEIEFIYDHWPNLEEVYLHVESQDLSKCRRIWGWLKSRRPYLRIIYKTSSTPPVPYDPMDQFFYFNIDA
ncbi:hypothetical protein BGZ68_002999 [Mortierella alpina]|nr:hypothetical protein BGZ68_002999 [Mortierella alpina]